VFVLARIGVANPGCKLGLGEGEGGEKGGNGNQNQRLKDASHWVSVISL
jgi:hypothetical protein